eukprot:3238335-Rhodomonas_salina.1
MNTPSLPWVQSPTTLSDVAGHAIGLEARAQLPSEHLAPSGQARQAGFEPSNESVGARLTVGKGGRPLSGPKGASRTDAAGCRRNTVLVLAGGTRLAHPAHILLALLPKTTLLASLKLHRQVVRPVPGRAGP